MGAGHQTAVGKKTPQNNNNSIVVQKHTKATTDINMADEEEEPRCKVTYIDLPEGATEETNWIKRAGKCQVVYPNGGHTFEGKLPVPFYFFWYDDVFFSSHLMYCII